MKNKPSRFTSLYNSFIEWIVAVLQKTLNLLHLKKLAGIFNFETVSYLVIGVLTTVVSYASFAIFNIGFKSIASTDTQLTVAVMSAQVLSWIAAVIFSFYANKSLVFKSTDNSLKVVAREFIAFVASRLFSFIVETLGMYLLYDLAHLNEWGAKIVMAVIVIVLNYITGKLMVFRKKKD